MRLIDSFALSNMETFADRLVIPHGSGEFFDQRNYFGRLFFDSLPQGCQVLLSTIPGFCHFWGGVLYETDLQ